MSDTPAKHTVILKVRGKRTEFPAACIPSAEALICRHLGVNKRQPLRTLRATATERVYTIPRGDHAAIQISPAC